jgi:hypothetical protein
MSLRQPMGRILTKALRAEAAALVVVPSAGNGLYAQRAAREAGR